VLCAATAAAIVVAAGGCGEDDLVFPGGTPPATSTSAVTQTVGTATPTPTGTRTVTGTPTVRGTVVSPTCSQSGQPCFDPVLRCCTGTCPNLPAPFSALNVCVG